MAHLKFVCDFNEILSKFGFSSSSERKFIGQEQDGSLLVAFKTNNCGSSITNIGLYKDFNNKFEILHSFKTTKEIIQATINASKNVLIYITKESTQKPVESCTNEINSECVYNYELEIVSLTSDCIIKEEMNVTSNHQMMAQFLYHKKGPVDRFLVFIHHEGINLYRLNYESSESEVSKVFISFLDNVVKVFSWAQWDVQHQCLYYIYHRKTETFDELGEKKDENISPTLSSLQFNDDFPHEMVLNIALNLPSTLDSPFNTYEDEPIPLRVHDSSLDVVVLSDNKGRVCICHHYLYQPVKTPGQQIIDEEYTKVHLAYSVTLLHHGLIVHSKIPGIPWVEANALRPTFAIHEDDYLVVYLPGLFTHLLDLGLGHQPCCHILLSHMTEDFGYWTNIRTSRSHLSLLNMKNLQLFTLDISSKELIKIFYDAGIGLYNKLSIIHYFLVHRQDFDSICQLLNAIAEYSLNPSLQQIFHEILVSGTYATVAKSLPIEACKLLRFLPFTTTSSLNTFEIKGNSQVITMSQEALWNPSVMLLTPQQRISQFRVDLWTQLWNLISESSCTSRFKPATVAEKLMVSLVCYQPEALSRCSTPLSPGGGFSVPFLLESANIGNYKAKHLLPFFEVEKCTASKQEHVISVNLRELSIHLVKHGLENPLQVHIVATKYAAAQLEMSRFLCSLITKSCAIPVHHIKGFQLIDELPKIKRKVYFAILERYASAVDVLAFPTPQGFSSFFTYLAYQTLTFNLFVQYIQARALSLQIDVTKIIFTDIGDDFEGMKKKLRLLQLLPRSRAKRILNQWIHPMSLILRAREHSLNVLSGLEPRTYTQRGFPSKGTDNLQNRYPPLDSFLDLLTAKASLAELDFNLLVESMMASVEKLCS